jgi:hypothetical protein
MDRISQHQIDLMRELFKKNAIAVSKGTIKADALTEAYWLSMMIITFMLGEEWRTRNISDNLFADETRVNYLRLGLQTENERYEHQFRMNLLADCLFLLQDCEGFDLKIEALQQVSPTNPQVKLEDIIVELQIAGMLVRSGHEVKFRPRSGVERQDFDEEICFHKESNINAEVKCKRDDTAVDVNNLRRSLYRAEKQLPTTCPGVVFARIPTDWLSYQQLEPEVATTLRNFFRNVSHVNAVVFIWEEWFELQNGLRASTLKYKLTLHPSPEHPIENLDGLLLDRQIPPAAKGTFLQLSFGKFSDQ